MGKYFRVLTQLFSMFIRHYIREMQIPGVLHKDGPGNFVSYNFNFFTNCFLIYIKKPYFCVPKLETRSICGLTTF